VKLYVAIGLILAIITSSFWAGYQVASGKAAKQDKKVITERIENHNADIISLEAHTAKIVELEKRYKKQFSRIPRISNNTNCPVDAYKLMWNEAATVANSVHIKD